MWHDRLLSRPGIQNGSPDGIALVDAGGSVVQFLSYEGSLTAVGGAADGMTSTDIGVSEASSSPVGNSLQLGGTGSTATDFTWQASSPNTFGSVNTGQTFANCSVTENAPNVVTTTPADGSGGVSVDANIDVTFSEDVMLGANWFDLSCSVSGNHSAITSGGTQSFTLDPDIDFANNELCTVTVFADQVSDVDAMDPPDNMVADFVFSFSTMVDSPIVINESDADTAGSDSLEFIELYDGGLGNTSLSGLVVVLYNGSNDTSYNAFDLDGFATDANGYFLMGNASVVPAPTLVFNNNGLQKRCGCRRRLHRRCC